MPKRSKKVVTEVEISSDEEIEEEIIAENDHGDDDEKTARSAQSVRNARKKARNSGYRKLAYAVGSGIGKSSSAKDMTKYAISESDLQRLATWCPETGDGVEDSELQKRLELKFSSLPSGAAAILHANVESFARKIIAECAERVNDGQSSTLTAAHLRSVLKKVANVLEFDFALPSGLVDHARTTEKGQFVGTGEERTWKPNGLILPALTEDDAIAYEEKKSGVKGRNKLIKSHERAFQMKKEERKQQREEAISKRRAVKESEEPISASV